MPVPIPFPPELSGRPFRLEEARALGLSAKVLRGRRFRRVLRGVYVEAELPDTLKLRVVAARLALPDSAVLSHETAALLRDLPVPDDRRIHATIPRTVSRARISGIVTHHASSPPPTRRIAGLRVTAPERTFVDLAYHLGLVDLTVLGDAMVRRGFTTTADLREATQACVVRRAMSRALRAAGLVHERVDSPMETRVRLLIVLAGLPSPEPGREVLDDDGQWVATVDLRYRAQRIAIEYDGDVHRTSRRKWRRDLRTRELLRHLGWEVIVLTADDVYSHPRHTLWRIHEALRTRRHPEVSADLDPEWETYFAPNRRQGFAA